MQVLNHICPVNTKEVLPISIKAIVPTSNGCALFLGNEEKVFVIYVDQSIGNAIQGMIHGQKHERPLTHDLMGMLLIGLGARVDRVVINDLKGATYYGRLIVSVENELQQRKVLELDARPSDCLAMASLQNAPIYITKKVLDEVEDMSEVLKGMAKQGGEEKAEG